MKTDVFLNFNREYTLDKVDSSRKSQNDIYEIFYNIFTYDSLMVTSCCKIILHKKQTISSSTQTIYLVL